MSENYLINKNKNELVRKSFDLVFSSYALPVGAVKLIAYCASQIEEDDTSFDLITVYASDFKEISKVENPYEELKNISNALWKAELRKVDKEGNTLERKRWVTTMKYYDGEGKVSFKFHDDVKPFLLNLKENILEYNRFVLDNVFNKYTPRIYEMLMSSIDQDKTGKHEFTINIHYLRVLLVLENSYPLFSDFRRYVIEPVINELNNTELKNIKYTFIKKGRTYTDIKFSFEL